MLRLLLRLWWLQQRRNFHKRDAFVACYIIFLYVVMGVSFFLSFTENGENLGAKTCLPCWESVSLSVC